MATRLRVHRDQTQGLPLEEALRAQLDVARAANLLAQSQIETGNLGEASRNLLNVETLTEKAFPYSDLEELRLKLRAQMFHCFACLRKSQGKPKDALRYAEKALDVILQLGLVTELPQCYLNLCGLMSAIGLHAEALKHALLSLQTVKDLLVQHTHGELSPEDADALNSTPWIPTPGEFAGVAGMGPKHGSKASTLPPLSPAKPKGGASPSVGGGGGGGGGMGSASPL
eukprot:RCo013646